MTLRRKLISRQGLFNFSFVLLLLLLIHELLLRWAANWFGVSGSLLQLLSLWKELAFAGVLAISAILAWREREDLRWFAFERLLLLWLLIGLVSSLLSPDRWAGLAAFRNYYEPLVLYLAARIGLASTGQRRRWLHAWLAVGLFMAVLGVWQTLAWGPADYQFWGFGEPTSQTGIPELMRPGEDLIRAPSTVTGPNELGTHMLLLLLVGLQLSVHTVGRWRLLYAGAGLTFLAGLALTYSRSNLLGLVLAAAILIVGLTLRRRAEVDSESMVWKRISRVGLSMLAFGLVLLAALALTGNLARLTRTINTLGRQYHIRDTLDAISFLMDNPAGVGMGLVGPRQGFGFPPVAQFHVEGSLFQIAMEMGVWGLAVFMAFIGISLYRIWQKWHSVADPLLQALCGTAFAGWIGALVAFSFLPLMQALPLMAWLWFLLGIGLSADRLEAARNKAWIS